jgi:hypothetical protein
MESPKSAAPKTTKHRLDDEHNDYTALETFEHECPMHKVQKLDESELQEGCGLLNPNHSVVFDQDHGVFNPASFLRDNTFIVIPVSASCATSIKNETTLAELNSICDEPIKTTSAEVRKDISTAEAIMCRHLKMLFYSLVFKSYDSAKEGFNSESATVLYEQIYKINIDIRKTAGREFIIYFGFPFYVTININIFGNILITRNNILKKLENPEEIGNIQYYSSIAEFNILDVLTTAKLISLIIRQRFLSGFNLLSKLLHTIEKYKTNSDKLPNNKISVNFERFVKLYKKIIKSVSIIPIQD